MQNAKWKSIFNLLSTYSIFKNMSNLLDFSIYSQKNLQFHDLTLYFAKVI